MWSHIFLFGILLRRRPSEFTAILMFEFWREATAASVPGFLCQSGRRRPENVSILSSLLVPENVCVFLPNQRPERRRPFGTGLVRHCPKGLLSPFFTFLRAIFSRLFRRFLAATIYPWVSEDGDGVINEICWWKFGWYFPGRHSEEVVVLVS